VFREVPLLKRDVIMMALVLVSAALRSEPERLVAAEAFFR
jgi:hypothetical protein